MRLTQLSKYLLMMLTIGMSFFTFADESKVPAPFRGENNRSELKINYRNLNYLLNVAVLDMGRSERKKAKDINANMGTRLKNNRKRLTTLEGNRFYFEGFSNEDNRLALHKVRKELEQLPSKAPLYHFSKKEQLAYWLNLHNVTLLDEIVAIYPKKNLEFLFEGDDALVHQKILTVAGVPLSLHDIENVILKEKYNRDPDILYGLYQGYIGAPNIRAKAYTGDNVYRALESNAGEFVNSNRGTYSKNGKSFYISSFYARNSDYFPNFESDITSHLLKHLEGYYRSRLENATALKANINNWRITDLYGTVRNFGAGLNTNTAAVLGSVSGSNPANNSTMSNGLANAAADSQLGLLSAEQFEILSQLQMVYIKNAGRVSVTDLEPETSNDKK